ncbi:hypothetical protein M8542_08070 [Amycolatopsis sp. OK19-0408]|uniref:Transmembrane protein n=1 Tax=Amycolatopsis iheyensis TaxID=2945988 RepID=A0A9X2SJW5_9PSEU|nr:hypothetical protein [Amycolatopsis iheyensis]MCR6482770.1 hypothetical protein [Amycolatopsis iheyensis]
MHNRKRVPDENESTANKIGTTSGEELPQPATNAGSPLLTQVLFLALTGDRKAFVRIVSLFVLLVGAVLLVGTVLPWIAAAVGSGSAWASLWVRRGARNAGNSSAAGTPTRAQS